MIEIETLTKKFGDNVALDNITFNVQKGEVSGFLGPNGAGKTTAMRILTGFLLPSSGTVHVDGLNVLEKTLEVRKKIGYLAENNPLYPDLQVIEYLNFISDIRKIEKSERSNKLRQVVDICGIGDILTKPVGELSKGYKQRVGLAQALIHNPDILILDEPTSGLDPNQIVEIRSLIKEIGKEKTVILSTHILPEVSATCEKAIIINKGRIVAQGTLDELKRQTKARQTIYTKIRGPKDMVVKELKMLSKVEDVKILDHESEDINGFNLDIAGDHDVREHIFNLAVRNNWTLLELKREAIALEDVFRELTTSET